MMTLPAMLSSHLTLVDCAVLLITFQWLRSLQRRKAVTLPPGPKGYPLIGNVFDMMVSGLWEVAQMWGARYGDLIYLSSFGQSMVVINSYDIAVELLEKRSLNYSDRPNSVMLNELQHWDWAFSGMPYGDDWRRLRAPMQKFFEPTNLAQFEDVLNGEAEKLLRWLLHSPKQYDLHIRTIVASSIMVLTYGHEVTSLDDPYVALARDGVREISLAFRQGEYLVDILPWLKYVPKWFPGAGFKVTAEKGARLSRDVRYLPFVEAREKIFSGVAVQSLTKQQVDRCLTFDGKLSKLDEDSISATNGVSYLGWWFALSMKCQM